ncbi:hypothetical protein [Geothrix oryzisoli]|uniref:hypothetical protein n=1 Tax=Geothrix oryzisoli TaxID=2922721 RepID=UPI001FAC9904|nr:hypothetical protein [Geothrix oryzisoli]
MIPTPAALLRVLTWMAFPEVFEAQVPDPAAREFMRKLAEKSRHATSTTEALTVLANELKERLSPEVLRKVAGGLGDQ